MKKFLYIVIAFITLSCFHLNVKAEVVTTPRNKDNNYCVNKDIVINNNLENIKRTPCVNANELVYDFANLLDSTSRDELKLSAKEFQDITGFSLVVYTVDENLDYEENESLAADFYHYNDFGVDEHYSGILLYRNVYQSKKFYMMLAFGEAKLYYNEKVINSILDYIEDDLSEDNYYKAFNNFIDKSLSIYKSGKWSDAQNYYVDKDGMIVSKFNPPFIGIFIGALITTSIIIGVLISRNKMVTKAVYAHQYVDPGDTLINIREDSKVSSHTSTIVMNNNSSSKGSFRGSKRSSSGRGHTGVGRRG